MGNLPNTYNMGPRHIENFLEGFEVQKNAKKRIFRLFFGTKNCLGGDMIIQKSHLSRVWDFRIVSTHRTAMLFTLLDRYDPNKASKHKYVILEAHKKFFGRPWVDFFGFVKSFFRSPNPIFTPKWYQNQKNHHYRAFRTESSLLRIGWPPWTLCWIDMILVKPTNIHNWVLKSIYFIFLSTEPQNWL